MGKMSVSIETRWMIIGAWQSNTKYNSEIARQFDVSETCVRTKLEIFFRETMRLILRGSDDRVK